MQSIPEFLYRYTNVDNLEYLLKNKTIRFSPLTIMDDPLEQFSAVDNEEGKCVFISCWTDKELEDKRMWKEYCRPDATFGIRIKMPSNPFSIEKNILPSQMDKYGELISSAINYQSELFGSVFHCSPKNYEEHIRKINELRNKYPREYKKLRDSLYEISVNEYYCRTTDLKSILYKVEYSNNLKELFPLIHKKNHDIFVLDFAKYGRIKDPSWAWQNEWRYILHFRSIRNGRLNRDGKIHIYKLPFDHYDLYVDLKAIAKMEIVFSPVANKETRERTYEIIRSEGLEEMIAVKDSKLSDF